MVRQPVVAVVVLLLQVVVLRLRKRRKKRRLRRRWVVSWWICAGELTDWLRRRNLTMIWALVCSINGWIECVFVELSQRWFWHIEAVICGPDGWSRCDDSHDMGYGISEWLFRGRPQGLRQWSYLAISSPSSLSPDCYPGYKQVLPHSFMGKSLRLVSSRVREWSSSMWAGWSRDRVPRLLQKRLRAMRLSSHCSGRTKAVAETGARG